MTADRYSKVAITLHWVIAAAILVQLGTGLIMGLDLVAKSTLFPMFQFHKSLGLTILILSLMRLVWRLMHKPPPYPAELKSWEIRAAKITHVLLYFFMIFVPFTGWLLVSSSSRGLPTLWFNLFQWPNLPGVADSSNKETIHEFAEGSHSVLAYSLLALLFLHVAAALKHHIIDRNEVLHRMIPIIKPRAPKLPLVLFLLAFLPLSANAASYTADWAKSSIAFTGKNAGEAFNGKFETWKADIDFDAAKPETSHVKVTINTASAKTGTKTYDAALPQKEWFDVKDFPEATFESKTFKSLGDNKFEVSGPLTIKGISKEITLPFTLAMKDKNAVMDANLKLNRLDYEIGKEADANGEWVSKDIDLTIHVEAVQK